MKKSLSLLVGSVLPITLMIGACGDDVIDASASGEEEDATARDATTIPPLPDGSADARVDVDVDAAIAIDADSDADVGDADIPDADGGGTLPSTFVTALQNAFCANYNGCCAADPNTPTGAGDPTCLESVQSVGFFGGLLEAYYMPNVAASSKVLVDDALAATCLSTVATLGCINRENEVTAATWRTILESCSGALHGLGVDGDDCISDIECDRGFSCRGISADPGGIGKCRALSQVGQPGSFTGPSNSDSCSYRGYGAGTELHLDHTNTCQPLRATGQPCRADGDGFTGNDVNCESRACSLDDEENPTGLFCADFKNDLYSCVYRIP